MANSLNENLLGKRVRFKDRLHLKDEFQEAVVFGGNGSSPVKSGTALFVRFDNGEKASFDGYDVAEIVEIQK